MQCPSEMIVLRSGVVVLRVVDYDSLCEGTYWLALTLSKEPCR